MYLLDQSVNSRESNHLIKAGHSARYMRIQGRPLDRIEVTFNVLIR